MCSGDSVGEAQDENAEVGRLAARGPGEIAPHCHASPSGARQRRLGSPGRGTHA